jgi:hypothetical protein
MLTEILLTVTSEEMEKIAAEVMKKEKQKADKGAYSCISCWNPPNSWIVPCSITHSSVL